MGIQAKRLADLLTATRLLIAGLILWMGVVGGPAALGSAVTALVFGWLTDLLDGPLARRDPRALHTWLGDNDLAADVAVAFALTAYMGLSGYFPLSLALLYLLLTTLAMERTRSAELGWAVQAPPYGAILYLALRHTPLQGALALAYIGFVLIATWPRFPHQTLPQFLEGMKALLRRRP